MTDLQGFLAATSPVLVAVLAGLGWLYRAERERRLAAEQQLSDRKRQAYAALLGVFFDVLKAGKSGKQPPEKALANRMFDANVELILYGADDVIKAYQGLLASARDGTADLRLFGAMIAAIRKDMGHLRSKIGSDEVLRQFITDFDTPEVQARLTRGR